MTNPYGSGPHNQPPNSGGFSQPHQSSYTGGFQYPGYQPGQQYPGNQNFYIGYEGGQLPRNNGLAITSMVLSLVAIPFMCGLWPGGLLALLGVIFGHVAQSQISRDGTRGSGMATAGLVIGYCLLGLFLLGLLSLLSFGLGSLPFMAGAAGTSV
ncbi:DUF4190 domain-containing protein [Actinopolyspora mortivallis]|uniref:DUF4190 domain-containing protein n=1 Tax=Actinopolyspora mortivallis TaxID=33906 RepID=A0A2T0GYL7_ACTMO|nr:DUF4190 domain-containing protein [Actinopolyspora mortivallis]PRW64123.1 DUF4190 domain-containing protein [Actinopolyspora mortivallis]